MGSRTTQTVGRIFPGKQLHNRQVSVKLKSSGLDPDTQTIAEMQSVIDARISSSAVKVLLPAYPMETDHETPIATEKGMSVIGWAHRSCNRSKGKLEIDHLSAGMTNATFRNRIPRGVGTGLRYCH